MLTEPFRTAGAERRFFCVYGLLPSGGLTTNLSYQSLSEIPETIPRVRFIEGPLAFFLTHTPHRPSLTGKICLATTKTPLFRKFTGLGNVKSPISTTGTVIIRVFFYLCPIKVILLRADNLLTSRVQPGRTSFPTALIAYLMWTVSCW